MVRYRTESGEVFSGHPPVTEREIAVAAISPAFRQDKEQSFRILRAAVRTQNFIRDLLVRRNFFDPPVNTQSFGVFGLPAMALRNPGRG
jgi:hypothetical protein